MTWLQQLSRRISMLFAREQFHRDLQEEMRLHRDLRSEAEMGHGIAAEEARAIANRQFGNTVLLQEESRDAWGWTWLEQFARDLRFSVRAMRRSPGFTVVAIIALALGIGANAAIFSVVNAVLLRPLLYKDPERLVTVLHAGRSPVATANYIDWRDQNHSFEAMAAADAWSANITRSDPAEHLNGLKVTQNLFPMLGVEPQLGRLFLPGEDQRGSEHEVILSYRLWMRRFAGDPQILGKGITLDGQLYTVIGVMPQQFRFAPFWATLAEMWVPNVLADRIHNRDDNSLRVFARLKPDVTLTQARAEMAAITARLERQYPASNRDVRVTPLKENVTGKVQAPLLVLLGAVGFVLLIACANVAHMLLARSAARQRETAIRAALGAKRSRLIRQFLTENLLLAFCGAGVGLLLAVAGIRALIALGPANLPRLEMVAIDTRVMLFLLGVTLFTGIAFGLAPAVQASLANLTSGLKDGARGSSDGVRRNRFRSFLVASEFALAIMLLVGAGLMIRSFVALQSIDPGFDPHNVISTVVSVAGSEEAKPGRRTLFYTDLITRIRALPGVESASGINHLPLAGDIWGLSFRIEGRPTPRPGESPGGAYRIVMPGYFQTMRIPLVKGRDVAASDNTRTPGVVVVNEEAALRYWPGQNPIGKRITFDDAQSPSAKWLTVIGIARNAKQHDWTATPDPEVFLAALQNEDFLENPRAFMAYITLVVRTTADPATLAPSIKNLVWSIDRNLPLSQVITMEEVVNEANAEPRFEMFLLGVFAAIALLLAAVGIYGVMSYSVTRRTHEIGIRISLGASEREVLTMVLRQGMTLALAGSAAGLVGALILSRLMRSMLFGVRPTDPATFFGVAVVLSLVALIATYVPARRATRIDPIVALRYE